MLVEADTKHGDRNAQAFQLPVFDSSDEQDPPIVDTEDEDEVTRCVCERVDSFGVMVQCEDCLVWQHCECMHVNPKRLPKHYFCEECKPGNHPNFDAIKAAHQAARESPPEPVVNVSGKRRSTMNSREAAQPYSELLLLKPGSTVPAEQQQHAGTLFSGPERPRRRSSADVVNYSGSRMLRRPSSSLAKPEGKEIDMAPKSQSPTSLYSVEEKSSSKNGKRKRKSSGNVALQDTTSHKRRNDTSDEFVYPARPESGSGRQDTAETTSSRKRRDAHDEADAVPPKGGKRAKGDSARSRASANSATTAPLQSSHTKVNGGSKSTRLPRNAQNGGSAGTSSRRQQAQNGQSAASQDPDTTRTHHHHHHSSATHSSTHHGDQHPDRPVKPRIPHAKSSLGEMNKRVKHLSDYITRLQMVMASETKVDSLLVPTKPKVVNNNDTPTPITPTSHSTSSADVNGQNRADTKPAAAAAVDGPISPISPAKSSSPADDPKTDPSAPLPDAMKQETSVQMLDRLNLSLIKFQERFGAMHSGTGHSKR
ncbi:uncharacterized protein EV422DRAFT_540630 [Fimicolochytrium jonesii]|uniref:uncharacterized protein n=1 Tax=Fimicolochytrium jonesii TaxID=1396493 RepID=UPI0022FF28AE|nr:uncharacterized protein EV422DRAFT_540630 [Fimicolochytrium jonesii]KAI8817722.1 hypothetical protein EV422DRAFT_540630 [Fimicolochytrium jonesii]